MNKCLVAVFSLGLMALTATAQPPNHAKSAFPMERADANGDGNVSWAEVREVAPQFTQERFNKLDRNGDGLLSKADVPQQRAKGAKGAAGQMPQGEQLAAILKRADTNGDKRVTQSELENTAPRLAKRGFARLDTNKDGAISEADFKQRGNPGAPSPKAVQEADANGDGQWSYDELKTVAKRLPEKLFKSVDADGDGLLNADEVKALRAKAARQSKASGRNADLAKVRQDAITKILKSDADGNGEVTFEELAAAKPGFPRSTFDRNDRNNDGVVSKADQS